MMKRMWALAAALCILISAAATGADAQSTFQVDSIASYRNIPGITQEEIASVEALKAGRSHFTYGNLPSTEAFVLPDGTNAGFATKVCALLSRLFDIPFVQEFREWRDLKAQFDAKLIDFTGELTPTPERMEEYRMTRAIAERSLRIVTHVGAGDISREIDLSGMKIGFLAGSVTAEMIAAVYPSLSFEAVVVDRLSDVADRFESGEIDALVIEAVSDTRLREYGNLRSRDVFPLVYTPVSLASANPDLQPIISVVDKYLASGGIDVLFDLYKQGNWEYAKYKLGNSFTIEERKYLADLASRGATVKTAFENDNYPVCFYNAAEGEYQGIAVDILREIGEITGLTFSEEVGSDVPWTQIYERLKSGEIDMVTQLIHTDERKDHFIWSDEPYASSHYALLSKMAYPDLSVYQVSRVKVGTIAESAYADSYAAWFPSNANIAGYATHAEALDALESGEIDLLMASEYALLTQTNYREKSGYKVNILFDAPMDSAFGFPKDQELLRSIIDKAQQYVDTAGIANAWTNRLFDYSKKYAAERANFLLLSAAMLFVLLVSMTLLLIKNKRLNRNLEVIVEKRTRELERQTATLTTIYSSIPDLVFSKDVNSAFTGCNPSFEKFAGCSEAELIGKTDAEVFKIDEEMARQFVEADKRTFQHRGIEVIEEPITYPDGSVRLMETIKTPLIQDGEVVGMVGISRDITQRKQVEDALAQRLKQQSLMAALAQNFISADDGDVLISRALKMAGEFMGIARILLLKLEDRSLHYLYEWHKENTESKLELGAMLSLGEAEVRIAEAFIQRRITHYDPSEAELVNIRHQYGMSDVKSVLVLPVFIGEALWGVLEFYQNERRTAWSPSDIDLGEMIVGILSGALARREMSQNLLRMSAIVNSSPQYIAYVNGEGKFDFFNPATHEITGFSRDELIAGGLQILYSDETNERISREILPRVFELGRYDFEIPLVRKDGMERIMSFSAFTIPSDQFACGTIATDVTEQKHLEQQLVMAKELAEKNSQSKSEFLSRMSHEMRTPMNAIIGMTKIGRSAADIERKDYCLDKIDSASTHLLGVINDVLDMSKIEAGKFELSNTDFGLEKMLIKITNVINFRMEEKGLRFSVRIGEDVPRAIVADEQRLSQVIANLLGNAVKFTPDGGAVSLSVRKAGEGNGLCDIRFEVSDTGIGISPQQQQRLFTSFEQADGSISRKYGGTGLGLAISKSIVELMGGKIWVESEAGQGSNFIFTIRAQVGKAEARGLLDANVNWENLRVLAVDDDPDVLAYFQSIAKPLRLQCEVSSSGADACRMIEERGPFNIVFIDWKMPEMDGIEMTRRIKSQYGDHIVVIMISATEWSQIEAEAKPAGVDKFIPKPLFSSVIVDCINDCLGQQRAAESSGAGDGGMVFEGKRILLVEDVEINREIVMSLLEPTHIQIDCAENGRIAHERFRDDPNYDMIFMDVHMPEVDGYESTRRIRALPDPRARAVPIIAMTANVFREDIEKCLAAGMNGHIGKPLDFNEVISTLKKYLSAG